MHRSVLQALIPALIALAMGFLVLRAVVACSGLKFDWRRLLKLHRCQHGGVQSLSFVLTLPLFIMIVMFIVQVSQLMVGIVMVHHAAFAAARAAIVWTPAHFRDSSSGWAESEENLLPLPFAEDAPQQLRIEGNRLTMTGTDASTSYKFNKIFGAAVQGVAPAAPGRSFVEPLNCPSCGSQPDAIISAYAEFDPSSQSNSRVPQRLRNKLSYAYWNTVVDVAFIDKDTYNGPTYNPRVLRIVNGQASTDEEGEWVRDWNRNEVGWQDPLIVRVTHDFALLPGPGRFLARYVVGGDGRRDQTAPRITEQRASSRVPFLEPVYTTPISATVTLTNEGFKPLLSYLQDTQ